MDTKLSNAFLSAGIKHRGAELCSLRRAGSDTEYIWQGDPEYWARHAPVLFPIVGRLVDDRLNVSGDFYGMNQHGFARDLVFTRVELGADRAVFELTENESTLARYPFRFRLHVGYALQKDTLCVRYVVNNTDHRTLLFSIGGHPAFNCPIEPGESFEDYRLEFEKPEMADRHFLEGGLFSGETLSLLIGEQTLPLSPGLFERDAIVFKDLRSQHVTLRGPSPRRSVKLDFHGFPFLGIWTKPGASFVCLEPWCGLADHRDRRVDFSEKEGVLALETGKSFECHYEISVT